LPESIEYIRAGKRRPLAVATATRFQALADIPIVSDFVPGYEANIKFIVSKVRIISGGLIEFVRPRAPSGLPIAETP
jgi:hypothetical protein